MQRIASELAKMSEKLFFLIVIKIRINIANKKIRVQLQFSAL